MIEIKKVRKTDRTVQCNYCGNKEEPQYTISFWSSNGLYGTQVILCKKCLKELSSKLNDILNKPNKKLDMPTDDCPITEEFLKEIEKRMKK